MAIELPPITWAIPPEGYPADWIVPSVGDVERHRYLKQVGIVATHADGLRQPAGYAQSRGVAIGAWVDSARCLVDTFKAVADAGVPAALTGQQVGLNWQLLVARLSGSEDLKTMFNPGFEAISEERVVGSGRCLSCVGVSTPVNQPDWVVMHYDDEYGDRQENIHYEGVSAWVIAHAIEHVRGNLVPDLPGASLLWAPVEALDTYDRFVEGRGRFSDWPLQVPPEQWQALSNGQLTMEQFELPG